MKTCPVCRASLNGASTCRRCRVELQRAQELERLGERLRGEAMLALAQGDVPAARQLVRRARTVHITPDLLALEEVVAHAFRSAD